MTNIFQMSQNIPLKIPSFLIFWKSYFINHKISKQMATKWHKKKQPPNSTWVKVYKQETTTQENQRKTRQKANSRFIAWNNSTSYRWWCFICLGGREDKMVNGESYLRRFIRHLIYSKVFATSFPVFVREKLWWAPDSIQTFVSPLISLADTDYTSISYWESFLLNPEYRILDRIHRTKAKQIKFVLNILLFCDENSTFLRKSCWKMYTFFWEKIEIFSI